MLRLTLALAVWISLVPVASASLAPRREPRNPGYSLLAAQASRRPARAVKPEAERKAARGEAQLEFVLTKETEVLLDGKPCKYEDIPANASILKMEVAADRKTVLRVQFRSGK
jgi:hypothetical protein